MARNRKSRRQQHGSAWHWKQTDSWYFTPPGTKKREALFDESGERIRGKDNKEAAQLALARIKVFDHVDVSNTTTQGYRQHEIGLAKTLACSQAIGEIDSNIEVTCVEDRFRPRQTIANVIFCCVDSITARTAIWRSVQSRVAFWTDGRMLGEVLRILAVTGGASASHYDSTLFAASEAQQGTCTSRSTIYAASIAAGLMVHQFTRWLRDIPIDADTSVNLLSGDWTVVEVP